jgi:hypothetical protein
MYHPPTSASRPPNVCIYPPNLRTNPIPSENASFATDLGIKPWRGRGNMQSPLSPLRQSNRGVSVKRAVSIWMSYLNSLGTSGQILLDRGGRARIVSYACCLTLTLGFCTCQCCSYSSVPVYSGHFVGYVFDAQVYLRHVYSCTIYPVRQVQYMLIDRATYPTARTPLHIPVPDYILLHHDPVP